MTTNKSNSILNAETLQILNNISILKHLNNEQKEILASLINDKSTKIEVPKEEYKHFVTISNKTHQLVICLNNDNSNYPFELLKDCLNKHEETWFNNDLKLLINQIGDFSKNDKNTIKNAELEGNDEFSVCDFDDKVLTLFYEFYLDNNLIIIRNYNADFNYFLRNSTNNDYTPIDIYNFFNKEIEAFNKTNYDILALFKAQQYFNKVNAYSLFNDFFRYDLYFKPNFETDYEEEIFLSAIYFKEVCIPKLQALIKPNLDILTRNGFDFALSIEENTTKDVIRHIDNEPVWARHKNFYWMIIDKKTNKQILAQYLLDFDFYGIVYEYKQGHSFKDIIAKLDEMVIQTANQINHHLQHNEIVAYYKILKAINYDINNVSFKNLQNNDEIHFCNLQFDYGYLKNAEKNHLSFYTLDSFVLLWKCKNDILYFESFKMDKLCILLIKHKELANMSLKHTLKNPKSFYKIVYEITPFDISFNFKINTENVVANPWENDVLNNNLLNAQQYTKYANYCKLSANKYTKLLNFCFSIPLTQSNINKIIHDIYNEFEDKIILKETVAKKIK